MDWPFLTQGAGFAVAVALTAACTNRDLQLPEPAIAAHASPSCDQATPTPAYYFPGAAFRWLSLHIEGTTEKPAQILEAMREPALSCGVQPESYRLVWIPALSGWMTDGGATTGQRQSGSTGHQTHGVRPQCGWPARSIGKKSTDTSAF